MEIMNELDKIYEELIEINMWKHDSICEDNCYKLYKIVESMGDLKMTAKALGCIEIIKEYREYCEINENNMKNCFKQYLKMTNEIRSLRNSIIENITHIKN